MSNPDPKDALIETLTQHVDELREQNRLLLQQNTELRQMCRFDTTGVLVTAVVNKLTELFR